MDVQRYKKRLQEIESELSGRARREVSGGRDQLIDTAADTGDASVADEIESESFTEAERDTATLQQVQDALRRIEEGTYGRCAVDGEPIEAARLDAMPWTPYCLKHEQLLEAASRRPPTL